ncbi:hypothetical protein ABZV34_34540 [Streptomyces sp. NPDC005195]|uniref:hypothetical protein n=1 Tax=Streptomyces sp. NPDC005195 TaxID=3154561 RepID=UPI0033B10BF1
MINKATAAGFRILALSGEVDADNVPLLRQALHVDGTSASRTVPDPSGLAMDSSAIGAAPSVCWPPRNAGQRPRRLDPAGGLGCVPHFLERCTASESISVFVR